MTPASVSDFRERARRRMPRFAFDFLDGGAGTEDGVRRNTAAFDNYVLTPRYLVNVESRTLATTLFGKTWSAPIAAAPIGLGNLTWPGAEEAIARAALAAGIPCTNSSAASTSLERTREVAGENAWFMLYAGWGDDIAADLVDRADAAGYEVMMVTVDIPLSAIRPRDIRNGFIAPFSINGPILRDLIMHPRWSLATLASGAPKPANIEKYVKSRAYSHTRSSGRFDWDGLKALRDRWPRRLLVKGLLSADDVLKARAIGCDGVVVSNHGGRQLDSLPAPIEVIAGIRAAVGPDYPLLLDSGIRSGEHAIIALALGADFVLTGRAIMYALGAFGRPGAAVAIKLLIEQAAHCLGQIGFSDIASFKQAAPVGRR